MDFVQIADGAGFTGARRVFKLDRGVSGLGAIETFLTSLVLSRLSFEPTQSFFTLDCCLRVINKPQVPCPIAQLHHFQPQSED